MLILSLGTGHLLRVITTVGGSDIESNISYVDKIAGTGGFQYNYDGVGDALASITTATTTTLLAGAASTQRALENLTLYNNHGSVTETVEIIVEDGTHTSSLVSCTLAPGEVLYFNAAGDWVHLDSQGGPYVGSGAQADQATVEAAASLTTVVSPGRMHYHPGMGKFVCMTTGGATPALQTPPAYNMTSITDSGAGRLTVTIATDFSSTTWNCLATVEYSSTTITNATVWASPHIRSASRAAGSIEVNSHNWTTITSTLVDPTVWCVTGQGDQ